MRGAKLVLPAVAGDILLLVGFAIAGRASHDEGQGNALAQAAVVAAPFIAAWLIVGTVFGAFAPSTIRQWSHVLRRIPVAWLVGGSLGLVFRASIQHRVVPPTFDAIALGFNLVTLTAWRLLLSSLAGRLRNS